MEMIGRRASLWIAWLGFVVLVLLHLDFWRAQRVQLVGGWVPEELAYRFVWMALAFVYMVFLCGRFWRGNDA